MMTNIPNGFQIEIKIKVQRLEAPCQTEAVVLNQNSCACKLHTGPCHRDFNDSDDVGIDVVFSQLIRESIDFSV